MPFRRDRRGCRALLLVVLIAGWALTSPHRAAALVVRFNSSQGPILVRLFHTATPQTTANFLAYVNSGRWIDTFIHRSIPGFVIQAGGYTYPSDLVGVQSVPKYAAVVNEPGISNLRGTIAMAKTAGNPNSATSEWFFNLSDSNAANLDFQNGGFTAFGRVVGPNGMNAVDALEDLPVYNASGTSNPDNLFGQLPLQNYSGGSITKSNLALFSTIEVLTVPDADYTFDGKVNGSDFLAWQRTLGSTANVNADGNGNAVVDAADLALWKTGYGASSAVAAVAGVPEPTTLALMATSLAALAARARRRRLRCGG